METLTVDKTKWTKLRSTVVKVTRLKTGTSCSKCLDSDHALIRGCLFASYCTQKGHNMKTHRVQPNYEKVKNIFQKPLAKELVNNESDIHHEVAWDDT